MLSDSVTHCWLSLIISKNALYEMHEKKKMHFNDCLKTIKSTLFASHLSDVITSCVDDQRRRYEDGPLQNEQHEKQQTNVLDFASSHAICRSINF